jgi:integrase
MDTKSKHREAIFGKSKNLGIDNKYGYLQVSKSLIPDPSTYNRMTEIKDAYLQGFLLDSKGLSPKNADRVIRAIKTIKNVWGIHEPNESNAILLKKAMREAGRSPNSIRQYLWALKYWAESEGVEFNLNVVGLPKLEKTIPKTIDFAIIRRMLADGELALRDRALILILSLSPRLGEVASIKTQSIDHVSHTILIHDTKTKKEKILPIPAAYWPLLKMYLTHRASLLKTLNKNTDFLFITPIGTPISEDGIRQAVYRISRKYGIDGPAVEGKRQKHIIHPHNFRHAAATRLLEVLKNPAEVQRITGHSSLQALSIYAAGRDEVVREKMQEFTY